MIDLNQTLKIKWNNGTKKHYESLGYQFTKLHDEFTIKASDLIPTSYEKVTVYCDCCGKEMQKKFIEYNRIIKNSGEYFCKSCATARTYWQKKDKNVIFKKFEDFCIKNNYIQITTIDEYKNANQKLYYICPIHGEKYITIGAIKEDTCGCRECSYNVISKKNRYSSEYIVDLVKSINNNELLNPDSYINVKENNMLIKCGSCGDIFKTSITSLLNGDGHCQKCAKIAQIEHSRLSTQEVIDRCTIDGEIMILNPEDYQKNSTRNLMFKCRNCGEIFITNLVGYQRGQTMCNKCRHIMSCGEEQIDNVLNKYHINHIFQFRFDDCRDIRILPFDFYLPDYNLIIEFDGQYHFEPIYGEEHLQMIQNHDEIKNNYCKINNIDLLRIPYWEGHNIEKLILEKLKL